jgi:hypothetical protein
MNHDGAVNRARYMPKNSSFIATKSPAADYTKLAIQNIDCRPELRLIVDIRKKVMVFQGILILIDIYYLHHGQRSKINEYVSIATVVGMLVFTSMFL